MKNKKIVTMAASLALCAVVGIGSTLAYLSDKTDTVTNTFTVGNVTIDLNEPTWNPEDAKDLETGASVAKDPKITNTGANAAYVLMKVEGMDAMTAAGFDVDYDTENWTLVDEKGTTIAAPTSGKLQDGYYKYNTILETGAVSSPLFSEVGFNGDEVTETKYQVEAVLKTDENGKVTDGSIDHYVITDVAGKTFATYEEASEYVYKNYGSQASNTFDLNLTAYAIQTSGWEGSEWVAEVLGSNKNN